jgi:hypothetical protein
MAMYRLLGAAAALALIAGPATAQHVIEEPGYCAFFYPNANCTNEDPGNPYSGDAWLRLKQGHAKPDGFQAPGVVAKKRARTSATRVR